MNRVKSIVRKVIGQAISIGGGYGVYLLTKDVIIALLVTAVMSRIMMETFGL